MSGGEGTILGTIFGVLIIGVMRNGLVLMGVSPFVQEFMIGLVIVIAVGHRQMVYAPDRREALVSKLKKWEEKR